MLGTNANQSAQEEEIGEWQYSKTDKMLISTSTFSPGCTFETNPIELDYSYGYDCENSNLCIVDPDTLLWYTGNIIHIFNAKQKRLTFRRSALGQDINCITKSKTGNEFAIGESGGYKGELHSPTIIVYEWPTFNIIAVLKGGATRYYKSIDFNCDGTKLVSQAGPPDDTLAIWDLISKTPILTLENPDKYVIKSIFSTCNPNEFVTCGRDHLKIWRLVETFTGLKIEGVSGIFDDFENCDLTTVYFLQDGRLLTNFRDGDLAVWRVNGMIELNLSMKNGESCHSGAVVFAHIFLDDRHIYTAGQDGKVRVWNYSYISSFFNDDQQESTQVDIEPSYERSIKDGLGRVGIPVQMLPMDDLYPYHFYLQDVKGGIWILDLELKKNPDPWKLLYACHSGAINDLSTSPVDYYFASLGMEGKIHVYSHVDRCLVLAKQFEDVGTAVLWLPIEVDSTGSSIVVGFSNGVLRVLVVMLKFKTAECENELVSVVQTIRPHSSTITGISINAGNSLLGSVRLQPIGMVRMPEAVCHITWNHFRADEDVLLVTCGNGHAVEMVLDESYFDSVIVDEEDRDTYVLNIPLVITRAKLRPQKGSKFYFSRYVGENLIWIEEQSAEHRHHNYVYEVGGEPVERLNISEGQTVHSCIEGSNGMYLILGLNNGKIKAIKRHPMEPNNFSNSWEVVMHKTQNCRITKLHFSYDEKILYSCGTDSGIFAYKVNFDKEATISRMKLLPCIESLPKGLAGDIIPNKSLEEEKIDKKRNDEKMLHNQKAQQLKRMMLGFLTKYQRLIELNKSLPKPLRIPKTFFRLETKQEREEEKQKIIEDNEKTLAPLRERLETLFDKVQKIQKYFIDPVQTANFYLFAIREPHYLKSFPERRLYSTDPLESNKTDEDLEKWRDDWEKLLTDKTTSGKSKGMTEFEKIVSKTLAKIEKEAERDAYYNKCKDGGQKVNDEGINDNSPDDQQVPDLITAAGQFLTDHNKFTLSEKQTFRRINKNRLKRLKCTKHIEKVASMKKDWEDEREQLETTFENLIKHEVKNKEKFPRVAEKLHELLNLRQLIYLNKEIFNKTLKRLRKEKTDIINQFYWSQHEYEYMVDDMTKWGLNLDGMEMPEPLEVIWDLEYPESLKFEPDPMPREIASRMEMYKNDQENIENYVPIDAVQKQDNVKKHFIYPLIEQRKQLFKNSIISMKETLDRMIQKFDKQFLPLLLERTKANIDITELKSEYNSVFQELDIIYRFDILKSSTSQYKHEIIKIKHVHILRENIRKKKINALNDNMKDCHRTIEDINAKFAEIMKDEIWANLLTRTYKRRFRPEKGEESSKSSSSEDDDEDTDFDSVDDEEAEQEGAGVAYLYDETIIPPGCSEEKFEQTFKFRYQRHAEENRIAEIRKEKDAIMDEVKSIRKSVKVTDALLAFFHAGTSRYEQMMKDELDDVEYLVSLHPSQIQIFSKDDPSNTVPPLEDCKLINQQDYLAKLKTIKDMRAIIEQLKETVENTEKATKTQAKDLEKIMAKNAEMENQVDQFLTEKYGGKVNVDEVQTYVLTKMIKQTLRRCATEINEKEYQVQKDKDKTKTLKQKEEILKTKKRQVKTLHTLYTIQAEKNRITAEKLARSNKRKYRKIDTSSERKRLSATLAKLETKEKQLRKSLNEI